MQDFKEWKKTSPYSIKKGMDGHYRVFRENENGTCTTDGQIKFTRAQINGVLKQYEGLEWATGEVRDYTGARWPGVDLKFA